MLPNPQFTEEILNGKLHFLCSEGNENVWKYLAEAHLITDYYCKRNVNTMISIGSILSKNPSCKER